MTERVAVEQKVLSENDKLAADIRRRLTSNKVLALNLVSSPGSGKTSLLEKTLGALNHELRLALVAGDVQTDNDARRLEKAGGKIVKPIVTGGTCHLDARMVTKAIEGFDLSDLDILFVENVGNLVCPSSYDLGEEAKIVLLSVTEGEDKPLKYPSIFLRAELLVLNKIDLLPYVPFDLASSRENARHIHPEIEILEISCLTGQGLDPWRDWLERRRELVRAPVASVG